MNFEIVRQNNGNLVAMFARVEEIGLTKQTKTGKLCQSAKLADDTGESHNLTIHQGNGSLLDVNSFNQRLAFNIQTYQGQQGLSYSGYWNNKTAVRQSAPPHPQQAPQRAPQLPKSTQPSQFDHEKATRLSIERQTSIKAACERFAGYMELTDEAVIEFAKKIAYFIATGFSIDDKQRIDQKEQEIASEISEQTIDDPPVQDSDIPPF